MDMRSIKFKICKNDKKYIVMSAHFYRPIYSRSIDLFFISDEYRNIFHRFFLKNDLLNALNLIYLKYHLSCFQSCLDTMKIVKTISCRYVYDDDDKPRCDVIKSYGS